MKNFLSCEEREKLKLQHKNERDKRICDRIKAVLLHDKGWTCRQIAEVLLLSDEAVSQHIQDYFSSHKLKPENGGSFSKLNEEQAKLLVEHLQNHTYLYVKDIIALVLATYGIAYTVPGMTNWLKVHGFSYKKPAVVPGKANRGAQEQWIKEYEELKKNLPHNAAICFIDGVHPTHNTKPTYGWIRKGERKEIPTNTGRQRLNLSGSIDIVSKKVLIQEDERLNASTTIDFLKMIETSYPEAEMVHVFCDNAKYYRNKHVQAYLITSKIHMHFLPPYSPNLNPIERLWKFMNERVLYNKYYEQFSCFREAVFGFLESLYDPPKDILEALTKRITDNFHIVGSSRLFAG
ncbi:MAG TPA: IS630 family transposase [Candidatus Babeliales bacterium]|nr:IS630 family transposase [Candidatus Babeliales bacterium]